jgi:4-hydroxybenzoate polyprenyltransferase
MVTLGNHIASLMRLIRWPNLVIVALTQVLLRQCVVNPVLKQMNMEVQLPLFLFILLVTGTVCITAGGYIINDYFDRKIDRVNRPETVIVGRHIYPRHAMIYHIVFTAIGIICGVWVAISINQFYLALIFIMVSGLLWFYSTTYKRQLLMGNFIVALLTGMVPFMVLVFELPLLARTYGILAPSVSKILFIWVTGFSLFSFLVNLLREIVKDAEDLEGDSAYGKNTVSVVWGTGASKAIAVSLIAIMIGLLIMAWFYFVRDKFTLIYFIAMVILPLLVISWLIIRASGQLQFHRANLLLKGVMLTGIGYMVVVNLLINYLK